MSAKLLLFIQTTKQNSKKMKTIVIYLLKDENQKEFNLRVFENEEKAKKYIKEFQTMWKYYSTYNNVNWIVY